MCNVFKPEAKGDIRHAPARLFKQNFGLLYHPAADDLRCTTASHFLQDFVEVVDMHREPMSIIFREPEAYSLLRRFQRELPFQQFDE